MANNDFQARGLAAKAAYQAEADKISANPDLSADGRRNQLAALRESTQTILASIQAEQDKTLSTRRAQLTSKLLDRSPGEGSDPSLTISYRDAYERVARLDPTNPIPGALALMNQATATKDVPLARTLLRAALDQRWPEVANAYTAANPSTLNDVEELWTLTEGGDDLERIVMDAFAFNV